MAGRGRLPFVLGPLNGNLDWPEQFSQEQKREREGLRKLRGLYKMLPYGRRTYRKAAAILAAFDHTAKDLSFADPARIVPMPEIGYDSDIFHSRRNSPAFSASGPYKFLYVGRLVPYKLPEVAIRAFLGSDILRPHFLHIVGDGPERGRLQEIVRAEGGQQRIVFEGSKSQAEVAAFMHDSDAFVFPSIRELGAGVVIEAMASHLPCIVTDYGAPGALAAQGRGLRVPMTDRDGLVAAYRERMEACVLGRADIPAMVQRAADYAARHYEWDQKAAYTARIYKAVLEGGSLQGFREYL